MKVLIVTLVGFSNYGNRLQNYALEQLLQEISCDVSSGLEVYSKEYDISHSETKWKGILKKMIPFGLYKIFKKKGFMKLSPLQRERQETFKLFSQQYLHMIKPVIVKYNREIRKNITSDYDFYVVGSDQVWNPNVCVENPYYFLDFAVPSKRISFSASFGVEELAHDIKGHYSSYLKDYRYISVREESGAKIIKDLINQNVDVTLDPTLLLEREKWEKMEKKPKVLLPENYVLSFFLGEEPTQAIEDFSRKKMLPIVHLNDEKYPFLFTLNPAEFLYVVKKASYVMTDSFHVTVFAIQFEREFYVFHRKEYGMENMFTRISFLLKRFNLQEREQNREKVYESLPIKEQHWRTIKKELATERQNMQNKMCEIMGINRS